jgi:hypothetical protein
VAQTASRSLELPIHVHQPGLQVFTKKDVVVEKPQPLAAGQQVTGDSFDDPKVLGWQVRRVRQLFDSWRQVIPKTFLLPI